MSRLHPTESPWTPLKLFTHVQSWLGQWQWSSRWSSDWYFKEHNRCAPCDEPAFLRLFTYQPVAMLSRNSIHVYHWNRRQFKGARMPRTHLTEWMFGCLEPSCLTLTRLRRLGCLRTLVCGAHEGITHVLGISIWPGASKASKTSVFSSWHMAVPLLPSSFPSECKVSSRLVER